ncbi:hypothetical protein DERF_002701 [Dermatophagoides farinae]|uniref:Endonuclease/exonuclease/phosphatase domain-containing protein n=1 Tax=Dermatophagoides farinae TaxID=6954 RepID=A0A922IB59_DERFA|nr:hypothetical protein DERF_002701 [Dermatophagoides farinae]
MAQTKRKGRSPNDDMERGMKQPRDHENVKTTTSSGKVSTQGTSKQPNEPLITIDDTSDSGDDAATFSSIPESNADKKILSTTITNVESAQLALKEFMDVNGTIKDSTKLRVIAVLQMVSDLQQEIFTCIVKMMAAQRYLNLGNVESIVVIISDCEEEMDDTSNDTTTQQEVPLSASSSRSTRPKRTPRNTVDSPSVTNSLTNYLDRPRYTTDADAKFIKSVHVAVGGLSGNITREIKRDTLIALSIADSMYSEIVLLRKRLMTATKRKSAVLDQDDDEIMDIGNTDNNETGLNIREEMNEMKLAINKLTALVQNNINLATTTPQRSAPQQQLQKTFSEVIKQHSANKTPIHRTIVSIPGNENSEATQQMLTTKIVPVNEGINIVESRKLSKGKVAIDFTSPESQQKFEDKVAATPELVHETPRILYPMMIIKGAPARIEKEQLPNMIKTFNHLICEFINKNNLKTEQEIEPVYARQNRKPGLRNFAIRVNPKLLHQIDHLKFAQLNTHKSPSSLTSFIDYCNEHHVDIMIVSEPPIKKRLPNFPSSIVPIFHHKNTDSIVRTCVCILNKRISPMILSEFSTNDFIVCQIGDLIISSVYANPNYDISDTLHCIDHLMTSFHQANILIAGDFNSSNRFWYSNFNDMRGDLLLATIIQNNLVVINNCATPTFNTFRRNRHLTSHIDLTMTSSSLSTNVHNWNVIESLEISDHRIITYDVNFSVPTTPEVTTTIKWNTNNINWEQWSTFINDSFNNNNITCDYINEINSKFDLDYCVSLITNTIQQACEKTMRRYNNRRTKRNPWHNDRHTRELLQTQKSLYRRFRRCYNENQRNILIEQYQSTRKQYREHLQKLKDDHLEKRFKSENDIDNYYNVCNFLKHHDTMPARTLANQPDPTSTVKMLLDYLFPDDNSDDDTQQQMYIRDQVNNWVNIHHNDDMPFHPVTCHELINAINKFNNNTSPGFDGLAPIICKQFVANFPDIAVAIYNQCLQLKHTKLMYLSKRVRAPTYPVVTMNNLTIEPVDEVKILGITYDRKLDYRPHIYKTLDKAARVFKKIMFIVKKVYGLTPRTAHLLLNCVFLPTITYGCHLPNVIIREPSVTTSRQVFTKSIRRSNGIGSAFLVIFDGQLIFSATHRFPTFCSILQADLYIIYMAINWIIENNYHSSAITIISNNIGAIMHIIKKNNKKKSEIAKSIIESTSENIIICWRKIDKSDRFQRQSRKKAATTANNHYHQLSYQHGPMKFVKRQEKIIMLNNWSSYYENDSAGTTIKTLCPHLNNARIFAKYASFWLSQSLTGHGQFGQFLYRFGFSNDQSCQCGYELQSVYHLRNDCPLTYRLRHDYIVALSTCITIDEKIKMEVILYEQIAMLADRLHNSIHQNSNH